MSCQDCEECQEQGIKSYYRWRNANIEIVACPQHLMEVFEALLHYQEKHGKKVIKNA
jgi:hypothetical protein